MKNLKSEDSNKDSDFKYSVNKSNEKLKNNSYIYSENNYNKKDLVNVNPIPKVKI